VISTSTIKARPLALRCPTLETERLILRGPEAADFEAYCAFLLDPVRSAGFGTEESRSDAWRWFACNIGHWALHGYGYFTSVWKETGQPCGITGIWRLAGSCLTGLRAKAWPMRAHCACGNGPMWIWALRH